MSGNPAARVTDPTACPLPGHGTNPIAVGSPNVLFDGLPAARQGDPSVCGGAMTGNVIPDVLINGMPAAAVGTVGSHGNVVVSGSRTVVIGNSHALAPFIPPIPLIGSFDEQFRIMDAEGHPLANVPFHILEPSGKTHKGFSNSEGKTPRIFTHGEEQLEITIGVAALEKWGNG